MTDEISKIFFDCLHKDDQILLEKLQCFSFLNNAFSREIIKSVLLIENKIRIYKKSKFGIADNYSFYELRKIYEENELDTSRMVESYEYKVKKTLLKNITTQEEKKYAKDTYSFFQKSGAYKETFEDLIKPLVNFSEQGYLALLINSKSYEKIRCIGDLFLELFDELVDVLSYGKNLQYEPCNKYIKDDTNYFYDSLVNLIGVQARLRSNFCLSDDFSLELVINDLVRNARLTYDFFDEYTFSNFEKIKQDLLKTKDKSIEHNSCKDVRRFVEWNILSRAIFDFFDVYKNLYEIDYFADEGLEICSYEDSPAEIRNVIFNIRKLDVTGILLTDFIDEVHIIDEYDYIKSQLIDALSKLHVYYKNLSHISINDNPYFYVICCILGIEPKKAMNIISKSIEHFKA